MPAKNGSSKGKAKGTAKGKPASRKGRAKAQPQPVESESESDYSELDDMEDESEEEVRQTKRRKTPATEEEEGETGNDEDGEEDGEDEGESSDEDAPAKKIKPLSASKLAQLEGLVEQMTSKLDKKNGREGNAEKEEERGVVYLGHIPFGFFEDQMRGFFSQFGVVTQLRLSRNKKTGNSKHYAFIEFQNKEVAKIVAETMDKYMMFGRTLECHLMDKDKVHPETFKNAHRKFHKVPWAKLERERHNQPRGAKQQDKRVKNLLKKEAKKRKKLAALGIEYTFKGYAGDVKAKPKKVRLV
jgi:nucleolar protein 15